MNTRNPMKGAYGILRWGRSVLRYRDMLNLSGLGKEKFYSPPFPEVFVLGKEMVHYTPVRIINLLIKVAPSSDKYVRESKMKSFDINSWHEHGGINLHRFRTNANECHLMTYLYFIGKGLDYFSLVPFYMSCEHLNINHLLITSLSMISLCTLSAFGTVISL